MSRKYLLILGMLTLTSGFVGSAQAQDACNETCTEDRVHVQNFWYDYYRNKAWPMPFRAMDASSVLSHFDVQRNNGWKLHNTIGAAMFEPSTCTLNSAGTSHVRWIVTRAPKDRQVVFVLQGRSPEETAKRLEATQIEISRLIPTGPLPTIYLTDEDAPGSSGEYQTSVARAINNSMPQPRLPAISNLTGPSSP